MIKLDLQELSNHGNVALALIGSKETLIKLKDFPEVYSALKAAYSAINEWLIGEQTVARELYYRHIPELTKFTTFFPRNTVERSNFFACLKIVYCSIGIIDKVERTSNNNIPYLPNEMAEFSDNDLLDAFNFMLKGADEPALFEVKINKLYSSVKSLCPLTQESTNCEPIKVSDLNALENEFN